MFTILRKLFQPGNTLGADDLRATVRMVVLVAVSAILVAIGLAVWVVVHSHAPSAVGEQAPDALVRLLEGVAAWCVCALVAYTSIQAWDNTGRARHLLHFTGKEHIRVCVIRIVASALIDAAIIIACALIFARVVGI